MAVQTEAAAPRGHSMGVCFAGSKGWKVVEYTDAVCLTDVRFVCSAKGRDYCRAKGMRWVHAWAEGTRADVCADPREGTDVV